MVTVQVHVVAASWYGRPSPGTIGPLTVVMKSELEFPSESH
jgi:hypothetical protein